MPSAAPFALQDRPHSPGYLCWQFVVERPGLFSKEAFLPCAGDVPPLPEAACKGICQRQSRRFHRQHPMRWPFQRLPASGRPTPHRGIRPPMVGRLPEWREAADTGRHPGKSCRHPLRLLQSKKHGIPDRQAPGRIKHFRRTTSWTAPPSQAQRLAFAGFGSQAAGQKGILEESVCPPPGSPFVSGCLYH